VAELVDALVSGTSGESRGGSSPLQGTNNIGAFHNPFAIAATSAPAADKAPWRAASNAESRWRKGAPRKPPRPLGDDQDA
jgi:hypothetical protein